MALLAVACTCARAMPGNFVLIKGGTFKNIKSNYYGKGVTVADFYIGKYDVTQKEWVEVMGGNPSRFKGDNLPVEMVSWYDSIEYCNKRSMKEGLQPYYNIGTTITINAQANGYRLPTEAQWEYAASGGQKSRGYTYSGSDEVDEVAWYWRNSGDKRLSGFWNWPAIEQNHDRPQPVGAKKPNELGLYDMSGNVRQWCWDWRNGRVWKGGGWMGADFCCMVAYRGSLAADGTGPDQGLRLVREARSSSGARPPI